MSLYRPLVGVLSLVTSFLFSSVAFAQTPITPLSSASSSSDHSASASSEPLASSSSQYWSSSSVSQWSSSSPAPDDSFNCKVSSESVWNSGFVYSFEVTNTGNQPVDGWEVVLDLPEGYTIHNAWGVTISGSSPDYRAASKSWNGYIGDNPVGFGIQGTHTGGAGEQPLCYAEGDGAVADVQATMHGQTVFVDALGFIQSLPQPERVTIDWGDGHSVYGAHEAWHTYFFPGLYEVTVLVETESGDVKQSFQVEAGEWKAEGNHAPVAVLSAHYSYGNVDDDVSLSGDLDGDTLTFEQYPVNSYFASSAASASASSTSSLPQSSSSQSSSSVALPSFNDVLTVTDGELGDTTWNYGQAIEGYVDFYGDPRPLFRKQGLTLYVDASDSLRTSFLRWHFGDGTESTETVTSHTYDEPGLYEVRLTATGNFFSGDITVNVQMGDAENTVPSAAFDCRNTGRTWVSCTPEQFYDADGDVLKYEWSLGDGTEQVRISTTAEVRYQYETPGSYEVTLRVSDGEASDVSSQTVEVTGD
ncbi:PKD domain-containing protein [Marinimicrobium agarilyticum]|uniref:PKD domain-containing protein n=1 Tax=Marinimicrobium agarilyticum TaxID=306546 RepID=UPI000408E472|nr:PKD domain-containing protein [Marinimicrobium agarilyticum]